MKGKLIVTWGSEKRQIGYEEKGVKEMCSKWKEQEFSIDIFDNARKEGAFDGRGPWDSDGDDGPVLEDRAGDLFFSRDKMVNVWEKYLKDCKEDEEDYEKADEPMAVIDFAKWIKELPEGAYIEVSITTTE